MFAALHYKDFRLLWYGSVMAGVGRWTMMVGQAWLVFVLTQSALWVGITTFAIMLPYLFGPILGGPMADRFDRRRLLMTTYLVGCGSVAALAVLAITDLVEPWHVIALGFVGGLARSVEFPGTQSLIPNLVPRANLLNGIALQGVANQGTRLIGPAVAAPLLATSNASGAFVVAAAAYLLAVFWAWRIHTPSRGQAEPVTAGAIQLSTGAWLSVQPLHGCYHNHPGGFPLFADHVFRVDIAFIYRRNVQGWRFSLQLPGHGGGRRCRGG